MSATKKNKKVKNGPAANDRIVIDAEKCVGCKKCARSTDGGAIRFRDGRAGVLKSGNVRDAAGMEARCEGNAIRVAGDDEKGPDTHPFVEATTIYFNKMTGLEKSPPKVHIGEIVWAWIGAFLGIGAIALLNSRMARVSDQALIIGSFGASAVLIYGAIKSPLAQPRNLMGGHILSAIIGVACWKLFGHAPWLAAPAAVATAIAVMHLTKTLHPPGGATALIAVIGSSNIHALGFYYAVVPVGLGAFIMLVVALVVNNISRGRRYPEFWV